MGYDERGRIYVRGELDAGDRLTAIRLLGALREALEGAPYMRDVTERVIYAEGGAAAGAPMRFELRAEWEV